jgi:hypothetical protein
MGVSLFVDLRNDTYPEQSEYVGKEVKVCFWYDTTKTFKGKMLRDDRTVPWRTIIQLEDGKIVEGAECQWSHHD